MTQADTSRTHQRELATVRALIGLAILSTMAAALAGLTLIIARPESGSALEGALGLTAAAGGLATAAFAAGAAIYAQVKDLWQYAPVWLRLAAWALIAVAVATTLWSWLTQLAG